MQVYGDKDLKFPYVPSHLHHMIFELVKNSLRAVNDRFEDSDDEAPPVRVVVAQGGEDVAIKVLSTAHVLASMLWLCALLIHWPRQSCRSAIGCQVQSRLSPSARSSRLARWACSLAQSMPFACIAVGLLDLCTVIAATTRGVCMQ